jgi:sarcosine oxidase subunit gamma
MADRSPLAGLTTQFREASGDDFAIAEISLWHQLNLRMNADDAAAWLDVLGVALPITHNISAISRFGDLLWLGPNEWLLASPNPLGHIETLLRAAADGAAVSVVDVSAGRTIISLRGSAVRQVLAHGCGLDLDAGFFAPGQCAQTRLALANVILLAPHDQPSDFVDDPHFLVFVRSSFATYLATWLLDAATEYTTSA